MTKYNDRPVPKWYKKAVLRSKLEFPRNARLHYAWREFRIQLFVTLVLSPMAIMVPFMTFSGQGHFILWFLFALFIHFALSAIYEYKEIDRNRNLTDIEALSLMRYNSIAMHGLDAMYEEVWADNYPHWAERIDPETGNVDPNRAPSDKPWREVKEEIKAMMQKYAQERQNISEVK